MFKILKEFLSDLHEHPWWTMIFFLLLIVGVAASLASPYFMKIIIDSLVALYSDAHASPGLSSIWMPIGAWFLISLINSVAGATRSYSFWTLMNYHYKKNLSEKFKQILSKDIQVFQKEKAGSTIELLDEGTEARWYICSNLVDGLLPSLISFVAVVFFSFVFSWQLTLVLLAMIPLQLLIAWYGYRKTKKASSSIRKRWIDVFGNIGDILQNIYAVKSFAQEAHEHARVDKKLDIIIAQQKRTNIRWMLQQIFEIDAVSRLAVLFAGIMLVNNGSITIGTLLMFMSFISILLAPAQQFVANLPTMQQEITKYEKLNALLAKPDTVARSAGMHTATKVRGAYTLRNVWFSYDSEKTILKNISFTIHPGEHIALVGPSGAGKSTLALLLARFFDPTRGSILLDDVNLREWEYDNLRQHIGVVWQENMLFHETLAYNIRYGKTGAASGDIADAAQRANILSFIERQKKKFRTLVGERGIRLSGGEKQRVMIARAMLKNAEVVILDEATSALDSITEKDVQEGIQNLIAGKTAIVIAHRLSTIKHADRIFVMDGGSIIASGPHHELMRTCELYQKMVELQAGGMLQESKRLIKK